MLLGRCSLESLPGEGARGREGPGWAFSRASSRFSPGEATVCRGPASLEEGVVGGQENSSLSFALGRSVSWSDARNTSSPKGRGKWLTAVGASSSLPHRLLLNCHYLLTYSPGCVRALPEVARGMISINSPPWGENELLLIYFSPRSLKPTKVTGTFIFCSFPISLTLRLFLSNILNPQTLLDIIHLPLIIHTSGSYRQCGGIVKVATLTRDGFQFISVLVQF